MKKSLRQARLNKDMTQEELAKRVGISVGSIALYEREGRFKDARLETVFKIVKVLGVKLEELEI